VIDALLYLTGSSIRNRLGLQFRRLRQPRYLLALLLGAAYFWLILLRPSVQPEQAPRSLWNNAETVAAFGILVLMIGGWIFSEKQALAFSQAEVQFLFPAPLTRRGLIGYKLFRSQLIILFNAIIWVFVLRRSGSVLAAPLRLVGTWLLFTNLSLHRLGAALVRTSLQEHGRAGVRRQLPAILLGGAGIVAVALILRDAVSMIRAAPPGELTLVIETVTQLPAARALLFLPRIVVTPTFAQNAAAWVNAAWPALVMLVLQGIWVLRSDVAFEESAVQASLERAKRIEARRRRGAPATTGAAGKGKRTLRLAPTGAPSVAIVWKNTLLLMRTRRIAPVVGLAIMSVVLALPAAESRGLDARFVAIAALAMVGLLIVLGSRVLQNDMRQDAEHLATLKTLPLAGARLVGAEVVSSALPIALFQLVLVLLAYGVTLGDRELPVSLATRTSVLLLSPLVLASVSATTVTIQNGAALLFPGWVRPTPVVGGGIEAMGQGILATGVLLLTFVIALLPATAASVAVWWLLSALPSGWVVAVFAAAATLLAEAWWAIRGLGRRFERMEP
jgi:ABC-2 type transport system permease protein